MDRDGAVACAICCGLPFLVSLILAIAFNFQTNMPTCSVQDLYIPALNTRLPNFNCSTTATTVIFFDVEIKNVMEEVGICYEYFDLTFYYGRKTGSPIANYTVPGFYQAVQETAHLRDVVESLEMPWLDAFAVVSNGSTAVFTVELVARVKLERLFGFSSVWKELLLRGDVDVNDHGEKVQKKAIKLRKKVKKVSSLVETREVNPKLVDSPTVDVYSA